MNRTSRHIACVLFLAIVTTSSAQSTDGVDGRPHAYFPGHAEGDGVVRAASSPSYLNVGDLDTHKPEAQARDGGRFTLAGASGLREHTATVSQSGEKSGLVPHQAIQLAARSDVNVDRKRATQPAASLVRPVNETFPETDETARAQPSEREVPTLASAQEATTEVTGVDVSDRPKRKSLSHYHPPPTPEPFNIANLLARMTIGTVTVLGVGVVGLLTARRWLPQGIQGGRCERMKLEETLALGKRCCVHLVSVENRKLVVVMDGGGVKSVEALNDPFPEIDSWDPENLEATNGLEQTE